MRLRSFRLSLFASVLLAAVAGLPGRSGSSLEESPAQPKEEGKDLEKERKARRAALKKRLLQIEEADRGDDPGAVEKAALWIAEVREAENLAAVQALVQLAQTCRREEVFRAVKEELGKFTEEQPLRYLASLLKPKDPAALKKIPWQARALAAEVLGTIDAPPAVEALIAALKDRDLLVLNPAIVSAGKKKDRNVIPALIDVVGRFQKTGGQEYHRARQSLVDLTGQDFFTREAWTTWWEGNRDSFDFSKKGEAKEAKTRARIDETKPEFVKKSVFFGTEIKSNRLLFLIDVSGSMQAADPPDDPLDPEKVRKLEAEEPRPELQRIVRARRELMGAIQGLDPSRRFNIIAFSNMIKPWKEELAVATEENKKHALEWARNLREVGGTFTDDALRRAFSIREVDTIYFLSDGAPQKDIGNPGEDNVKKQLKTIQACLELVRRETRFRKVAIHSFGLCGLGAWHRKWGLRPLLMPMDPKLVAPLRQFMEEIAKITGGEFKAI